MRHIQSMAMNCSPHRSLLLLERFMLKFPITHDSHHSHLRVIYVSFDICPQNSGPKHASVIPTCFNVCPKHGPDSGLMQVNIPHKEHMGSLAVVSLKPITQHARLNLPRLLYFCWINTCDAGSSRDPHPETLF